MDRFSFLNTWHSDYIDDLYQTYLKHPEKVEPSWRTFFQGYDFSKQEYEGGEATMSSQTHSHIQKEFCVINLINAYRFRGHLFTKTNPVRERRKYSPTLDKENFGLSDEDLDTEFDASSELMIPLTTLRNIIGHLERVYCQSIGTEYMYVRSPEQVNWIKNNLHKNENQPSFSAAEKKKLFQKLNQAVTFENFLHTKFTGQKRFSLEGCESLIPALETAIEEAASQGVEEFVMGMAHRGRLNVLVNIMGKEYKRVFSEFEAKDFEEAEFDGDVKYHMGSTQSRTTSSGKEVTINLAPNPSHLETVDPIVQGIARAKINNDYDAANEKVMPILIHGDAAVAAQGVVYETIQMMSLDGYKTGGTIHIAVNNQIGFTTNYIDARSSTYCTDVAKVTLCPVFHVNADDVEAVVHVMKIAVQYRNAFKKDIFIDLLGYRKYGHNEGDEPRFTQPTLYKKIASHPNSRDIYLKKLSQEGVMTEQEGKQIISSFKASLDEQYKESKEIEKNPILQFMPKQWEKYPIMIGEMLFRQADTKYPRERLWQIARTIGTPPEGYNFMSKIKKILGHRIRMMENNHLDWSMGELLAYGTLLEEGYNVRVSGQDVERGTFSHRHAIIKAEDNETEFNLLNHLSDSQGRMAIYNSLLSEYGVLGFDYGYAMASPDTLVIWEAQFGDFSNGAQIIIDQYLSASEDKWKLPNGLVMLLPHGYEGQGAEHSSARIERYLQLCAQDNMQILNCTTPANFFHALRRQMKRPFRKPMIVFTPKSLLRHPQCVSTLEDISQGSFQEIIDDPQADVEKIDTIVFCTGKFYYELIKEREDFEHHNYAIIRIEQLYPFPTRRFEFILNKYHKAKRCIWTQEEPKNMGPWSYMLRRYPRLFTCVAQRVSAATAPGSSVRHAVKQKELIKQVFRQNFFNLSN